MCCWRILFIGDLLELRIAETANTHTHTYIPTVRQADRQIDRLIDFQTERHTYTPIRTDRQKDRQPERQTDSIGGRQIHERISAVTIKKRLRENKKLIYGYLNWIQ